MTDFKSMAAVEGDDRVIAMAQHTVKTLGIAKNMAKDMIKILSDFDDGLSNMTELLQSKGRSDEIEERLDFAQEEVLSWDSESVIWDCGPDKVSQYLNAVDEIRKLTENLGRLSLSRDQKKNQLLHRAQSVLQMAMARLEEEFLHILVMNRQPLEPEHLSFRSSEEDVSNEYSNSSFDQESVEASLIELGNGGKGEEEFIIDLIHREVIPELQSIADIMFLSNYDRECCQAYISVRRDALDECLFILEVEKLSIEVVQKMDWDYLNRKIKKWIRAMKIFIRVILASEKHLCDQIFRDFGSFNQICFVETAKGAVLQLLNFGEAIAISQWAPERLFRILDMYEGVVDLLPDIESLFSEESGSSVRMEVHEVLQRLGESVKGTFMEFENAIQRDISITPFAGGGIHHLTKYVMNYIKALTGYNDTLNMLLEGNMGRDRWPPESNPIMVPEEVEDSFLHVASSVAHRFLSVTSILESNLDAKSKLYRDISLQHFFLMNNIYYMFQKVTGSDLGDLLGNDWIREHKRQYRLHAVEYERATWKMVLSCLRDDGLSTAGSGSASRVILRDRFKSFNIAFEEIYKTQTAWLIRDVQLRDELRISISLKVLPAYRIFWGRYKNLLEGSRHADKYIKFTPEDLENYLLDFFEGSSRSLHNSHWR